jgi:hypothetical protein
MLPTADDRIAPISPGATSTGRAAMENQIIEFFTSSCGSAAIARPMGTSR